MKNLLVLLVVIVLALIVWLVWRPQPSQNSTTTPQLAGDNAVYLLDQGEQRELTVATAQLSADGFVVILEAPQEGGFGAPIGASALLRAGKNENVPVVLEREVESREQFFAMLYADSNANGTFDAGVDEELRDSAGNRVFAIFYISSSRNND